MFPVGNDLILFEVDMFRIKRFMLLFGCDKRGTVLYPKLVETWVHGLNRYFSNPADVPTHPGKMSSTVKLVESTLRQYTFGFNQRIRFRSDDFSWNFGQIIIFSLVRSIGPRLREWAQ